MGKRRTAASSMGGIMLALACLATTFRVERWFQYHPHWLIFSMIFFWGATLFCFAYAIFGRPTITAKPVVPPVLTPIQSIAVDLHSDLQVMAFQLAKEMREFLTSTPPIPPIVPAVTLEKWRAGINERSKWRQQVRAMFQLKFGEREVWLRKAFAINLITMRDLDHYASGNEIEKEIEYKAQQYISMAHRLENPCK